MSLPTVLRQPRIYLRLFGVGLALLLSFGATLFFAQVTPADRIEAAATGEEFFAQKEKAIGTAALGQVYLQATAGGDEVAMIKNTDFGPNSVLGQLNRALDPLARGGGLYQLRKAFEALSIWILIPLIFLQLGKAVATGLGQGDAQIAEIAKRLAIVVVLMWGYTLWDVVIFRMISLPVTAALNNPSTYQAVSNSINSSRGRPNINIPSNSGPTAEMSVQAALFEECNSQISVRRGPSTHAIEYLDGGSNKCRELIREETNPMYYKFRNYIISTRPMGTSGPIETAEQASKTFTGILSQAIALLLGALIWFVWLGVIIGRAFSLCLAPLALAWGMNNTDTALKWFKGHASIVLKPVAITLAVLFIWALNNAIFVAPLGGGVVGLGTKIAIAVLSVVLMVKSGSITNIAAGDVTAVAAQIGTAATDKAASYTTTGVKGLSAGAAYMRSGGREQLRERWLRGKEHGETMLGGADKNRKGFKKAGAGIGAAAGAAFAMAGDTAKAAKWMHQNKVQTKGVPDWQSAKGATVGAYKSVASQVASQAAQERRARPSEAAKAAMEDSKKSREAVKQKKTTTRTKMEIKAGDAPIRVSTEGLPGGSEQQAVALMFAKGFLDVTGGASPVSITTEGGDGMSKVQLSKNTEVFTTKLLSQDKALHDKLWHMAEQAFGGKDKVPFKEGLEGKVLDISKAAEKSTEIMEILVGAGRISDRQQEELARRAEVSDAILASGAVLPGSIDEMIARNAPADFTTNSGANPAQLKEWAEALLREAWYEAATPEERKKHGLKENGDALAARGMVNLMTEGAGTGLHTAALANGAAELPSQIASRLPEVFAREAKFREDLQRQQVGGAKPGEKGVGVVMSTYRQAGRIEYQGQDGSKFEELRESHAEKSAVEIYKIARDEAYKTMHSEPFLSLTKTRLIRGPGESDENYEARKEAELQKFIFTRLETVRDDLIKEAERAGATAVAAE